MSEKRSALEALRAEAIDQLSPRLTPDQRQIVFADGDPDSPLVLVGETPTQYDRYAARVVREPAAGVITAVADLIAPVTT